MPVGEFRSGSRSWARGIVPVGALPKVRKPQFPSWRVHPFSPMSSSAAGIRRARSRGGMGEGASEPPEVLWTWCPRDCHRLQSPVSERLSPASESPAKCDGNWIPGRTTRRVLVFNSSGSTTLLGKVEERGGLGQPRGGPGRRNFNFVHHLKEKGVHPRQP